MGWFNSLISLPETTLEIKEFAGLGLSEAQVELELLPALQQQGIVSSEGVFRIKDEEVLEKLIEGSKPIVIFETVALEYRVRKRARLYSSIFLLQNVVILFLLSLLLCSNLLQFQTRKGIYTRYPSKQAEAVNDSFVNSRLQSKLQSRSDDALRDEYHNEVDEYVTSLPHSPHGYICVDSTWGRQTNILIETIHGINMAALLNKTWIVPEKISQVMNLNTTNLIFPNLNHAIVVRSSRTLHKQCRHANLVYTEDFRISNTEALKQQIGSSEFVRVKSARNLFFYKEGEGLNLAFARAFFSKLQPTKRIQQQVASVIQNSFGNHPYIAVHLRDLESTCEKLMLKFSQSPLLCSPDYNQARRIAESIIGSEARTMPIFVLSDRERKGILHTYLQQPDTVFIQNATPEIDFEIASRSAAFIGTHVSSASRVISRLRTFRKITRGISFPSITQYQPGNTLQSYQDDWLI